MSQKNTINMPERKKEALAALQFPVYGEAKYRLRLPALDAEAEAGAKALVAMVRFFDGDGAEMSGPWEGTFSSERFGSYVYLQTSAKAGTTPWSQFIHAPGGAAHMDVEVHGWRVSKDLAIVGDLELERTGEPLFQVQQRVVGEFPVHLYLGLEDLEHKDRAAVVQVRYQDPEGKEIPGAYEGCNHSERFGQFAYASTPKEGATEVRISLVAPEGAASVRFTGHKWKGTSSLGLKGPVRVVVDAPQGLEGAGDWVPVKPDGRTLAVVMPPEGAGGHALLQGEYFAQGGSSHSPAVRLLSEFLDAAGRPVFDTEGSRDGILADPVHLLGPAAEVRPFACFVRCPPAAVSANLRVYPMDGVKSVALRQEPVLRILKPLPHAERLTATLGVAQRVDLRRPAFGEWRLRVAFEGLRTADPENGDLELCIFFGDRRHTTLSLAGIDIKVQTGSVRTAGNSLYLKLRPGASGDPAVELLRGTVQILPPSGTESVTVRIVNPVGSEIPYTCSIETCDALAENRLSPSSATHGLRVEEVSPEAARVLAGKLLEQFPEDSTVLSGAIDVYRRLGDASQMRAVGARVLGLPKSGGKLKHKARHILASLEEQDPNWSIQIPGEWEGQSYVREEGGPLRVAHLFKTSLPHENTGGAIRCMNMVKFQKQMGLEPMVVTPLGYPSANVGGELWECEEVEGVPHYRLNGIHRDDLRTIPSTRQLEYTSLLTATLLREKGVDVVQASSGYRGYEQALVGIAVARKLKVPFVYEVRSYHEHTWRPMAEWVLDAEFTRRRMSQEDRCMREADAVVTICETMKKGLVERGIPDEKIFVVPNSVDLDKFQQRQPDTRLRRQLGLKEGFVAGYISNISAREGHHVLLRAVAVARARGVELQCLVVGDGPELQTIKRLANTLGIAGDVVFTGDVPHARVSDYYGLIDAFVVPRVADFASDFVTPMKPFEAMAMGVPVVISDRPALREVVEPNVRGLMFKAGDAIELAERLIEFYRSPELRERLRDGADRWIRTERTWTKTISRYSAVYSYAEAVHNSRGGA